MSAATRVDLPAPGGPGDADEVGPAGQRVQPPQGRLGDRGPALDRGQQPGEGAPIAGHAPHSASSIARRPPASGPT